MSRAAALALVAAALGCATVPPCPARGGPAWSALRSAHFVLRTDLDGDDARTLVRQLEETRAAILAVVWPGSSRPTDSVDVIAFRRRRELSEFAQEGIWGQMRRPAPLPATVLVAEVGRRADLDVTVHELVHDLSFYYLPLQPLWFSEGIATQFETLDYDDVLHRATVGAPSRTRMMSVAAGATISVPELMGTDTLPDDPSDAYRYECTSWLVFRYLLEHHAAGFARFQTLLGRFTPWRTAWAQAFPDLPFDRLDHEVAEYQRESTYPYGYVDVTVEVGAIDERPMSDAEVHALRAFLYATGAAPHGAPLPARARAEAAEALAQDPGDTEALAALFYLRDTDGAQRRALAERAAASGPPSWLAAVMLADARGSSDPGARAALVTALAREPHQPELLARLARVEAASGRWDQAEAFSTEAIRRGDVRDLGLLLVHAQALARTGQCPEASFFAQALEERLPQKNADELRAAWPALAETCRRTKPPAATPEN
jgi:hypothetical protein